MKIKPVIFLAILSAASCNNKNDSADAYGNFEATTIYVSSQISGPLLQFTVQEGDQLKGGQLVGFVDTVPLILKLNQVIATREEILSKNEPVAKQVAVIRQQEENLKVDQKRMTELVKSKSATQKQLDDINGQLDVLEKQIESVYAQNAGIGAQLKSVDAQVAQLRDQISRSYIYNPIDGTVLTKYAEQSEIVGAGKNLYEIADLTKMELRAYVSGSQLSSIRIGQKVRVKFDTENPAGKEMDGTISWISSTAEFTPKIVQTKEERTSLVYAFKASVDNSGGQVKIGMPGEVLLK